LFFFFRTILRNIRATIENQGRHTVIAYYAVFSRRIVKPMAITETVSIYAHFVHSGVS